MLRNETLYHVTCTSTILTVLVIGIALFPVSVVRANRSQGSATSVATYRTKCAMCHGQDGGGSAVGKSMNVPDLHSQAVKKLPDVELAKVISNGQGGMPPFKNSLIQDQIQALVSHIRS